MVHTIAHFGAACHVFAQKCIHMLNVPKAAVLKPVLVADTSTAYWSTLFVVVRQFVSKEP